MSYTSIKPEVYGSGLRNMVNGDRKWLSALSSIA
jgi:hypothetical protein